MFAALRKRRDNRSGITSPQLPPEAFLHEDDVTPEVVKSIQDEADKILKDGDWVVIDGYVGKK